MAALPRQGPYGLKAEGIHDPFQKQLASPCPRQSASCALSRLPCYQVAQIRSCSFWALLRAQERWRPPSWPQREPGDGGVDTCVPCTQVLLVCSRIWERPGPAELLLQMCWIWSRCVESCRKKAALGSFIFSSVRVLMSSQVGGPERCFMGSVIVQSGMG